MCMNRTIDPTRTDPQPAAEPGLSAVSSSEGASSRPQAEEQPSARRPGPPRGLVNAPAPVAGALAGRRFVPLWALIRHRGRRSGTEYATPIAVVPTRDRSLVMIGLPWGARTNWARNVLAAGGATLRWKGREVELCSPRVVDGADASESARWPFRLVLARFPAALVLERGGSR